VKIKCACLLLAMALLGLSACDNDSDDRTNPELTTARQLWDDAALQDYQYTLSRSCFCEVSPDGAGDFVIAIKSGAVESAFHRDSGVYLTDEQIHDLPSIDDLFALVDSAYRHHADRIEVTYDPTFGFPLSIYIDRRSAVGDDEIRYQISEFM
jgi:hypothetical protein